MRLLFASLLALLAAIAAGVLFNRDTGRVILTLGEWTVQTTMSFFVVAVFVLFVVLYLLIRSLVQLFRLPRDWGRWSSQRRGLRSERFLLQGLVAMLREDWRTAERAFHKGAPFSRMPALNFLGAARSAQRQGAMKRRDHYLKLAHDRNGEDAPEVELVRAALQFEGPDSAQAYSALKGIEAQHPRDDQVRIALLDAAIRLGDWTEAERLLESTPGIKGLPDGELRRRQMTVHDGLLRSAAASRERLEARWRGVPAKLQREPELLKTYVRGRLRHADTENCEPLVRKAVERLWDTDLVVLYGRVHGTDSAKQLRVAESWLKDHAGDGALLLTLGRLCRQAELWGKAREYLEESARSDPRSETFLELGGLYEQQGDLPAATDCYRRGLGSPV